MSSKKTIKINPELFNMSGGNKTQKNRERKQRHVKAQLINPNAIKKQLLSRIKEHKNTEHKLREPSSAETKSKTNQDIGAFTDEFMDSINYLSSLSKERKELDLRENYENVIREKRENFLKKTVKNPTIYNQPSNAYGYNSSAGPMQYVQLELPDELKENPLVRVNNIVPPSFSVSPEIKINLRPPASVPKDVPYGCLKGGSKPTYRAWQSTRKNYGAFQQPAPLQRATFSENSGLNSALDSGLNLGTEAAKQRSNAVEISERERRLKMLQEKMKRQHDLLQVEKQFASQNLLATPIIKLTPNADGEEEPKNDLQDLVDDYIHEPKKMIKRTIKRKYTLGKSAIKKQVGILIKDNRSRKNVLNAHKELKKKPLTDVKNYLRDHGLIKVGSNAPNDVLRKIYEASMLTGDVTNNSKDILLHNFLSETSAGL